MNKHVAMPDTDKQASYKNQQVDDIEQSVKVNVFPTQNEKGDEVKKNTSSWHLLGRLAKNYVRPYTGMLFLALILMAVSAAMTAGLAQLMQPILDDVLGGSAKYSAYLVGTAVFGTFFIRGLSTYAHIIVMNKIGQSIVSDIQKDLFKHFMGLDLTFFHAHPSGQLISRVVNDVNVVRIAVSDALTGIGKNFLTLIFLVGVMFYQDWKLSIAAFAIVPFLVFFVANIGKRLRKVSKNIQSEMGALSDRLSQIFLGIRQVQAYRMEEEEIKRASLAIESVRDWNIKSVRVGNMSTPVNEILIGIVAGGIIIHGGLQVTAGNMTTGQLVAFLSAFTLAYEPMKKLAKLNNNIQMGLGGAERIFSIMDEASKIREIPEAIEVDLTKPEIHFKNVEFQYDGEEEKALDGVSFHASHGTVTALVGHSGSGKTTLMNLIPRFYDPVSGEVIINGQNIKNIKLESLRGQIALVSQDITIFDDTVASNIAYGRSGASYDDIIKAADMASADAFIRQLPQGYETRLGENGVKLSGGQRQRIAIARALLYDAPILLLDEATSALDNESEREVQEALKMLEKGRTTIVIAHRLSTVRDADNIIVLDSGKIVEQGTHPELIAISGLYKAMVDAGLENVR